MDTWTKDDLERIGKADELQLASRRRDGTLRKPVTIWVVRLGDNLYVRCVNGTEGAWFRGVRTVHEGRIKAGGVEKDVRFVEQSDPDLNDQLDEVYRSKYQRYGARYVDSIITTKARATTIRLVLPGDGS